MGAVEFLARRAANHAVLSPLTFLQRARSHNPPFLILSAGCQRLRFCSILCVFMSPIFRPVFTHQLVFDPSGVLTVHPQKLAIIHGSIRRSWQEYHNRVLALAAAFRTYDVKHGSTVAVMLSNTPEMLEAKYSVPLLGATLCSINTRLDPAAVSFILKHSESSVFMWDSEFDDTVAEALDMMSSKERDRVATAIKVVDPEYAPLETAASGTPADVFYHDMIVQGAQLEPQWDDFPGPTDEWDAIALNYTSGTTGNPKGVLLHHRGAYLNSLGNILTWSMSMDEKPVYLWTLPMFHCNGWCFPWTIAALTGTHVCLRTVTSGAIYSALADHAVTHFCGAPIVMQMVINATHEERRTLSKPVKMMTAASPPPASVLAAMKSEGIDITHVYGLTEVYGPAVVCDWQDDWSALDANAQAGKMSRQGVRYPVLDGLMVADPETMEPISRDGKTIGEIFMKGNIVMKGYLKNEPATEEAFGGGWFHTGDLAVLYPDGYLQIADRSKDIIISGGENISSIEVQDVLYQHPAIADAAVVARPDEIWGETPCAFVELKPNAEVSEEELDHFCQSRLARFKRPRTYVFGSLPKTSIGKIQKFELRERAREL